MRRFTLTLMLFGMAVAAAFAAPRLMPAPAEVHGVMPTPPTSVVTPGPVEGPAPEIGVIVTIPELDEPVRPLPPIVRLPPDPPRPPEVDPCPACGMG